MTQLIHAATHAINFGIEVLVAAVLVTEEAPRVAPPPAREECARVVVREAA